MSAIYGCVTNFNKSTLNINDDLKHFEKYSFDRKAIKEVDHVTFSCHMHEITVESTLEVLPYYDINRKCMLTADLILDNREELLKQLDLKDDSGISDSSIVLNAYYKWGEKFPSHLIGDFAVAIYDFEEEKLVLARDQLGKRSLYYSIYDGIIKFSTIERPVNQEKKYNKSYFIKNLSLAYDLDVFRKNETIYKGVYFVKPAEIIVLKGDQKKSNIYWRLKAQKSKNNFEEDIEEVKEIFIESVKCRLRTKGNVGLMLSGGLDSNSIAYIAADMLKSNSKDLYTYTSKSKEEYDLKYHHSVITDESKDAELIIKHFNNIMMRSSSYPEADAWRMIEETLYTMEEPYKYVQNCSWLFGIYEDAAKDNCKVLLNGQFGNMTFSLDNITKHLMVQLFSFRIKSFLKDLRTFCLETKQSRKAIVLEIFDRTFFYKKYKPIYYLNDYSNLNKKDKRRINKHYAHVSRLLYGLTMKNSKLKAFCNSTLLHNVGAAETKHGLKNNLIQRDPTRDIRLVEKCYNLPSKAFNDQGRERALAKNIMKGIVPDEILFSQRQGLQSADWLNRIENEWSTIHQTIKSELIYLPEGFINLENFNKLLDEYEVLDIKKRIKIAPMIKRLLIVNIVCKMFKDYGDDLNA